MDRHKLVNQSKRVSWLLRHGAAEQGLRMDEAGWAAIGDVLRALRLSRSELDAVVAQNDKRRFEIEGERIRACQGHSTPAVSLDAVEASWTTYDGASIIYHGTNVEAARSIAREGITAQSRTHVHLAPSRQSKVGKRWNVALLLAVDPAKVRAHGIRIFTSPNGVLLARRIPPDCIIGVEPLTREGASAVEDVKRAFGVVG